MGVHVVFVPGALQEKLEPMGSLHFSIIILWLGPNFFYIAAIIILYMVSLVSFLSTVFIPLHCASTLPPVTGMQLCTVSQLLLFSSARVLCGSLW